MDASVIAPMVASSASRRQLKPLPAPIARKPGDVSPAMVCQQVFDSISVHANGDIVCWCVDLYGKRVYGNVFTDRIADVFDGPAYQEIRRWMLRSRPDTWCPAIDDHCSLRTVAASEHEDVSSCRIKQLQLESTSYCNLKCPVCPVETSFKQDAYLREHRARKMLPLNTMLDVVAQLPDLEVIHYYDYGEPFLHKDTIAFLREVKQSRPGIFIATSTNGTVMTPTQIQAIAGEALMDRINFSIDGAAQESYGKYRVGGSFNKAFGKMKRLVEASRAAGTWRKYVTDPAGRLQITWQYILFEWNDSDEEIQLARQLAQSIDVPIQWVLTSGYGASKRFLPGSAEIVKLHDPPDSFIHLAALTEIETRLAENDVGAIKVSCDLLKLPYALWRNGYRASFRSDRNLIVAPAGSMMTLHVNVVNRSNQRWNVGDPNYLRLGVQLKNPSQAAITELTGAKLTSATTVPGGSETITIPIRLPGEPGEYKLVLDMVHEFVCWFGSRGSSPEVFDLRIE